MTAMKLSIKSRIYWSFSILVFLFVINAIITIVTLEEKRRLSNHISKVLDPSLQAMDDFNQLVIESKMYISNWVFLRANQSDKERLIKLHTSDYPKLKSHLVKLASDWEGHQWIDSLKKINDSFEQLLGTQEKIMGSLQKFEDYDDPVVKLETERIIEDEVLPHTTLVLDKLNRITSFKQNERIAEQSALDKFSKNLRLFIILLAITIVVVGVFFSVYMSRTIIRPINQIRYIVNDMSKGVTNNISYSANGDEIGKMIHSVNNLSDKLKATTKFAQEIGDRNFNAFFEPLSDEDSLGKALIAMRDNLRNSEVQLLQKNKELEQFAYVASHDLQEPLRTISGFVELLQQQYHDRLDKNADKYLNYIIQSSDRMKVLISDLLEYSRIGKKKEIQFVDCNELVRNVLQDLGKAIEENQADIRVEKLPVIDAYPTEMKQLFQNLIINAIKFRRKGTPPQITISARKIKQSWTFAVQDNGIGISKEHRERIFIIFQRLHTRSEYEGSGIGLAHCKKIVELHGGKIWVESQSGIGSTFYFIIPEKILTDEKEIEMRIAN
jgi:signal transduction histidine kinase